MDPKESVLLDTDIGGDIDDILTLAYLLLQPKCDLVGITTVRGDTLQRARLADAVCRALGRHDAPVFSGTPSPIMKPRSRGGSVNQEGILERWEHRRDFAPAQAIEFMRKTIRSRPHEMTLLAVGPLTNIGLLFSIDPEIPSLLKGLVLMGGAFYVGGPPLRRWNANILDDPFAASIVYNTAVRHHVSVGLEVTYRCGMPLDEGVNLFRSRLPEVVVDATEVWAPVRKQQHPFIYFHDPLAAATIFEPDVCTYEQGKARVDTSSLEAPGATWWEPNSKERPHTIAVDVDVRRFFDHYFEVVSGSPLGDLFDEVCNVSYESRARMLPRFLGR